MNAGATLLATGDLGGGNDVLDVAGTLDAGGGSFYLGDGDDSFVVHDGTLVSGTVDGGAGVDTRVYNINLTADVGTLAGFEGLTKTRHGRAEHECTRQLDPCRSRSVGGTFNVTSGQRQRRREHDGGCRCDAECQWHLYRQSGNDTFTVAGTVDGSGSISLGGGDDVLTLQDGAALNTVMMPGGQAAGDSVVLDNAGALTFAGTNVVSFESS